ncbi:MAG: helix-turn-helix domain-containing protein [Burkholderiales bacterium]|nr:helix-turn-helix domain-containing protein [Burkholderiales bacterium]
MPQPAFAWRVEPVVFPADVPVHAFFHRVQSVDFHLHPALELLLVLSGSIMVLTDEREQRIDAGGLALIHGNQIHATHDLGAPNLVLALQIDPTVARHDPYFGRRRFDLSGPEPADAQHAANLLRLRYLLARTMYEIRLKRAAWQMEVEALVLQLIALLVRRLPSQLIEAGDASLTADEAKLLGPRLRSAADYIRQHAGEPLSIGSLAQALGLSSGYLARLFKGETGITFGSFITHVRLRRSLEHLDSREPARVIDIALECGFPNVKAFNSAFRRVYRCTPSEWRRSRRNLALRELPLSAYPRVDEARAMDLLAAYLDAAPGA